MIYKVFGLSSRFWAGAQIREKRKNLEKHEMLDFRGIQKIEHISDVQGNLEILQILGKLQIPAKKSNSIGPDMAK